MEYWQCERGNKKSDLQQAQSQSSTGTELSSHCEVCSIEEACILLMAWEWISLVLSRHTVSLKLQYHCLLFAATLKVFLCHTWQPLVVRTGVEETCTKTLRALNLYLTKFLIVTLIPSHDWQSALNQKRIQHCFACFLFYLHIWMLEKIFFLSMVPCWLLVGSPFSTVLVVRLLPIQAPKYL